MRLLRPLALASFLLIMAACGSSSDSTESATSTPESTTTTSEAATADEQTEATTTPPTTTKAPTTTTTEVGATTTTTVAGVIPSSQLVCDTIDAAVLGPGTLLSLETGVIEEDYCSFAFTDREGALRIEVVETGLEDPIGNFTTLMRLTGDVYASTLADGAVLGVAQDRDLFVVLDGVNLWKISAPQGAVDRDSLSRVGTAMTMEIPPRDTADIVPSDTEADADEEDDELVFDGDVFCQSWIDIEAAVDAVLEAPDVPGQMAAATAALELLRTNQPDGSVLGWDEFGGGLATFLQGAEVDDFDLMDEGLALVEQGEPSFNVWLAINC